MQILADAGYQGPGAQTSGRVVMPPHRKFEKNPLDWYQEIHKRQRKATPDAVSASSTAAHTSETGGHPPGTWAETGTCATPCRPWPDCSHTSRPPPVRRSATVATGPTCTLRRLTATLHELIGGWLCSLGVGGGVWIALEARGRLRPRSGGA